MYLWFQRVELINIEFYEQSIGLGCLWQDDRKSRFNCDQILGFKSNPKRIGNRSLSNGMCGTSFQGVGRLCTLIGGVLNCSFPFDQIVITVILSSHDFNWRDIFATA